TGLPGIRQHVTNFGSYAVMTEPVPDVLNRTRWIRDEGIYTTRTFVNYFRTTPDRRILMGSGSGPVGYAGRLGRLFTEDRVTIARATRALRTLIPLADKARVIAAWGGPIDISADRVPMVGTFPQTRVHFGCAYSGHGVGPSWIAAQILASLVLSRN